MLPQKYRRRSDDAVVATFNETINPVTLDTSFAEYTFHHDDTIYNSCW